MPGLILTVLEHPEIAARLLSAARCLAVLTSAARVNVLAIRIPPIETIMPTEEVLSRKNEVRIRAEERHRADALKAMFDAWAGTAHQWGLASEWFDVEGRADKVIEEWGRRADVIALKRPWHRDAEPDRQAIHAALFATGRPVLVVPPEQRTAPFGRRVAL